MFEDAVTDLILEMDKVTYPLHLPFDVGLPECSLVVAKGSLVAVRTEKNVLHSPLADLALGLIAPESGTVRFMGQDWQHMAPDAAAALRGRIGCVFAEDGWVNNLDVDENLLLAQLHHTRVPREALLAEATELARRLGLNEIPHVRVHLVTRCELRVLEWVRAFLGEKSLLILQYPMSNVPPARFENLLREIHRVREKGTGVLWIMRDDPEWQVVSQQADRAFEWKEQQWLPMGGR